MTDQPFIKFEIREKIRHFKDNRSFDELSSLELQPIIKVYESKHDVEVSGHLVLSGEFTPKEEAWESQFDQADGIHYGAFFKRNEEIDSFQYQIPLSIQIGNERVADPTELLVVIEDFDYEILSDQELELVAHLKLLGIHPNPDQDLPVYMQENIQDEEYDGQYDGQISKESEADQQKLNSEEIEIEEIKEKSVEVTEDQTKEVIAEEVSAEADQDHLKTEEITEITLKETTEKAEEEPVAKMKIGVKGNSKEGKGAEESSGVSPLYSLFKKEKKETGIKEAKENQTPKSKDEPAQAPVEAIIQDEIQEELQHQITEQKEEPAENKSTKNKSSKDMLFSLLRENEGNRQYKMKIYLVQKEETLEQIAEKYATSPKDIVTFNRLASQVLTEGQLIYLPVKR